MRRAITKHTCMVSDSPCQIPFMFCSFKLVASAPNFPHGVIDPIEDIAKVCIAIHLI